MMACLQAFYPVNNTHAYKIKHDDFKQTFLSFTQVNTVYRFPSQNVFVLF